MSKMGAIWRQLLGIALGGACVLGASCATAQITPDRTLPNNSSVTINGSIFNITGGTQAGRNLFHSFQQFSVPTGGTASFNNGLDIQNIFSRVTGSEVSNIDGLIKASGTANLFFLNPNGIVFGKNASLSIGGSFVATTANAIQFGNLGAFSASEPNNPALLTVNPTALFYNQIASGAAIQNSSIAPAGIAPTGLNSVGLSVPDGKSLLLVGGDLTIDGALRAYGGRVELGGLTSPGTVGLAVDGNNFSLSFPPESTRASVSLINGANVNIAGGSGGSITVNANNLNITGGSTLNAGIAQALGSTGSQGGDITLNATGDIKIDGSGSGIFADLNSGSVGRGGDILVQAGNLFVTNGGVIRSSTFGKGDAGNISIKANNGISLDGASSDIVSNVQSNTAQGNGGNIDIITGSLSATNGAFINSFTRGTGNAGNVTISAKGAVTFNNGSAHTEVEAGGVGNGGNINITAGSLSFTNGSGLSVDVREAGGNLPGGQGLGGSINLNVGDALTISNSGLFANFGTGAGGRVGDINITTGSLSLTNGGTINTNTSGKGNAGNIFVTARDGISLDTGSISSQVESVGVGNAGDIKVQAGNLFVKNGGFIISSTSGKGDAGNISIKANNGISLDGASSDIVSNVQSNTAQGNGGNIDIITGSLSATNGAFINSFTRGTGNAGNVTISAKGAVTFNNGSAHTEVDRGGVGNGGNINITAGSLSFINGSGLSVDVREAGGGAPGGQGLGGSINLNVGDALTISSGGLFANFGTGAGGRVGDINITTGSLSLTNSGTINSSTFGKGDAGNIFITARDGISLDGAYIASNVQDNAQGNGGNIDINTGSLSVNNGAFINSFTRGQGNAGNITITAKGAVTFDNGSAHTEIDRGGVGKGGNINITAGSLSLTNASGLSVDVREAGGGARGGQGLGGSINLNVGDALTISSGGLFANFGTGAGGRVGDINITTGSLSLTNSGTINSNTSGRGNAGNIFITARDGISLDSSSISSLVESAGVGNAGNIKVQAGNIFLTDGGTVESSTLGKGDAGNISITAGNGISLDTGYIVSNVQSGDAVGKAGNIDINTGSLSVKDGSQINSFTLGTGNAGNITITANNAIAFDGVSNGISSAVFTDVLNGGVGNGGSINITTGSLSLTNSGVISSSTSGKGDAGSINITTGSLSATNSSQIDSATHTIGNAGNITITAKDAVTIADGSSVNSDVTAGGVGRGGDINITADSLSLIDHGQLFIGLNAGGQGIGRTVNVNVANALTISGTSSGIFAGLGAGATGHAGDILVQAGNLFVTDRGEIRSNTGGKGDAGNISVIAHDGVTLDHGVISTNVENNNAQGSAGNINITTGILSAIHGGQVNSVTHGKGNAGNVTITARNTVTFDGSFSGLYSSDRANGVVTTGNGLSYSGSFSNVLAGAMGKGGDINITTGSLSLTNGGQLGVNVNPSGQGNAGDIAIIANSARLNNGQIVADTASGNGGNITFYLSDYLLLRHGSLISSTAGTDQAGGNGGNITINTPFLVAVPNENSDIIANAFSGSGGQIQINATSVFGLTVLSREDLIRLLGNNDLAQLDFQRLPTSAITAVSQTNPTLNGTVVIDTANINPSQELVPLSTNLINTNTLIANSCIARTKKQQGTFNITGTDGLPNHPGDAFMSSYPTGTVRNVGGNSTSSSWHKGDPIVEPQGVYQLPNGHLVLSRECS